MTAIITILNKKAAAVAADSAVTIDEKKVYMNGEKLFSLAPNIPVAVAIYGNLNLISVPWDILIKEYGKYLTTQQPFPTLKDYAIHFFDFLHQKNFYITLQEQQSRLKSDMLIFAKAIITNRIQNYHNLPAADLKREFDQIVVSLLNSQYAQITVMESLNNLSLANFQAENDAIIDDVITSLHVEYNFQPEKTSLADFLYRVFCSIIPITNHTGLVFAGYGNNEIYPRLYNYEVRDIINGRIAAKEKKVIIDNSDLPTISSFAQNDMFHAIVKGISPEVNKSYKEAFKEMMEGLISKLNELIPDGNPKLDDAIQATINQYYPQIENTYLSNSNNRSFNSYIKPLVDSIGALDKLDLAEFAENIIKVTEIRKNIITDQLNTVGGPIDVLVITKGDGLVWMKRKQYIDLSINN